MPRTVLIADESITIRSVAESLLRGESFSVHSAADGNMALEIAHAERPDLALVGEKLAGLGGAEVCKAIKSDPNLGSMPIIFMRADRPGPAPEFTDSVLTKPFSPQSLLDAVHRFLASDAGRGEGTSPVPIAGPADAGLEEELIDQALGLDDVGPAPAEEREIAAGRSPVGLDLPNHEDRENARPFGLVDDNLASDTSEDLEDLRMSKAIDESFGLEAEPEPLPPSRIEAADDKLEFEPINSREPDDEVDMALGEAFGEMPSGGGTGAPGKSRETSPGPSKSSLNEVSLGEPDPPVVPERLTSSSAAPGGSIDLGGGDEVAEDRPHDYDWFIKEMQQDPKSSGASHPPHEPPRIEPLSIQPKSPPAHNSSASEPRAGAKSERPQQAYDDFISEFRAEIAKIEGMAVAPPALAPEETDQTKHSQSGKIAFSETGERSQPTPPAPPATIDASIRAWGDELIDTVTAQVARELAAKIDSKMIYSLIEQKLKDAQKNLP